MNQGEIIHSVRLHDQEILDLAERLVALEKKVKEMDQVLKSPIRREAYAARQKFQQDRDVDEHQTGDGRGEAAETGHRDRV